MTQPWPPCTATMHAMPIFASRSASSSTMSADLPPSSRKRRFMVAPPFSMMRLPVAVEPVNEMRSTSGLMVELLADQVVGRRDHVEDTRRDVGLLGDEAAEAGGVPRRVRRGLEDDGVARGERLAELLRRHLERDSSTARSRRRRRRPRAPPSASRGSPNAWPSGSSRRHSKESMNSAGQVKASLSGASSCGP